MFTGLVQAKGNLKSRTHDRIVIEPPPDFGGQDDPWKLGESIAVNGCCLTLVSAEEGLMFELSPETFAKTSFGTMPIDAEVNLERAMRIGDRLGGHMVQGHVDASATCESIVAYETYHEFVFQTDSANDRYLIEKGSITVDGISLTVVSPNNGRFSCWIIPTTFSDTNLGSMQPGQQVNIEIDMVAKHIEKLVEAR